MVLLAIVMLPTMATSAMLEYQSVGLNSIAEFHFAPSVFDGQSIRIGELNFLLDGVPTTSLCAKAEGNMLGAPYEVEIVDLATQSLGLNKAAYLYRNYFAALSDGVQAAGLQVAIWEVIHDDNNPETGALYITGNAAVVASANSYLALLSGYSAVGDVVYLRAVDDACQDVFVPDTYIPEPATLAMMATGIGSLFLKRKRS